MGSGTEAHNEMLVMSGMPRETGIAAEDELKWLKGKAESWPQKLERGGPWERDMALRGRTGRRGVQRCAAAMGQSQAGRNRIGGPR